MTLRSVRQDAASEVADRHTYQSQLQGSKTCKFVIHSITCLVVVISQVIRKIINSPVAKQHQHKQHQHSILNELLVGICLQFCYSLCYSHKTQWIQKFKFRSDAQEVHSLHPGTYQRHRHFQKTAERCSGVSSLLCSSSEAMSS